MDAMEAIRTRRSIRKYVPGDVDDNTVRELIDAAMMAPSAGDQRPWEFIVVRDRTILDDIPAIHPYSRMVPSAAVAIVVCGTPAKEKHKDFWVQDCSAATQNLLLAAHALGLGAVWLGVYPRQDRMLGVRKLLNIPEDIVPLAIIPIGRPAERLPTPHRFDATRVHHDRW